MKYIFVVFILCISSCSILSEIKYDEMLGNTVMYNSDFGDIHAYSDIANYIANNIEYMRTDEIQNPEITILLKHGECLDQAILFMNIAYYELDIEMSLIFVSSRTVVDGGLVNHAEVHYNGKSYSVATGLLLDNEIGYIYNFDEVFQK